MGPVFLSSVYIAAAMTLFILIPFTLPEISCFTLSLKCFSSDSDNCSPTNTPVFPPSSFLLPSFAWFYVFFFTGQALLSAFSWCSACSSMSEDVFLMHLWREMYSTSTTPPPSCSPRSYCVFLIISILMDVKCNVIVILIYISLIKSSIFHV